ncbi:hypothetical protein ANN_15512 [Periplaneta americana]|uniref:Uncharacterized protein n=1 Tax=Periplaneta americana TaxID=6978 RepID=A0ABQ8SH00_PERAM|nr:hypothetical protein ANN_15512 [Periplaneta americana]
MSTTEPSLPPEKVEKKQKSRQKEPEPEAEEADNEIVDLSDPEKITKERGIVQTCGLLLQYMMYNDMIMRPSYIEMFHIDVKLNRKLKLEVLQSCILPTLLYGCQTWKLTVNQKTQIQICQRKMERKILGLSLRNKISNTRLKQMTNTRDMAHQGERLKWKWGGHVSRLQGCRWAHISTTWDPRMKTWDQMGGLLQEPVVQNSQEPRRMEIATVCKYRQKHLCVSDLKLRGRPRDNALELPVAEGPTSSAVSTLPLTLLIWFTSLWLSKVRVPPILNLPP